MMNMSLKEIASKEIDAKADLIREVSRKIHDNPELGHQEHEASKLMASELKGLGYEVEMGTSGLATSFKATLKGRAGGPTIAVLAEYDALPKIGHACGHNLIAAAALGTAAGLKPVMKEIKGTVVVFGTPAEEGVVPNAGGKVIMIDEIGRADAAVMIHAGNRWGSYSSSLARESFTVEFHGKASHAGGAPEKGVNALEGVLLTFQGINALRQHLSRDIRVHGIITHGGDSPNTVPHYASAHLYVRAPTVKILAETYEKVQNCARAAATATGAKVEIKRVANPYANKIPNKTLSGVVGANMRALGVDFPEEEELMGGGASTDYGNVSQVIPALNLSVNIGEDTVLHSPEGAVATGSERAHEALLIACKALAHTAIDLFTEPSLLRRAKEEQKEKIREQS